MFEKSFTPKDITEAKNFLQILDSVPKRSEERRVGKECL